jgi:pyruvate dehydrogenase E2 component (dihydrolipoamide acetyltransferase)
MARLIDVRVPDMGSFSEVAVIDVLVKPGDPIEREASLITLETEKATMDVPSDVSGVIEKIHVRKGGKVSPGDVVVTVRAEDGAGDAKPAASAGGTAAAGGATAGAPAVAASTAGVTASGASTAAGSAASASGGGGASAPAKPAPSASGGAPPEAATASTAAPASTSAARTAAPTTASSGNGASAPAPIPGARTDLAPINEAGFSHAHAGPSVRRFARELGVDLSQITGTGFKARITHDDVKAFVKKALGSGTPAAVAGGAVAKGGGTGLPTIPAVDFSKFGPVETKPLSRIQKISGPRLHASWVNIPHVTQFDEADITDLEDVRTKLKQKALQEGIKLTPLAFIVRACAKALVEFPFFNSSLDATGANLVMKKYMNIGFAADTPNGLVVPVIHNADRLDIYKVARQLAELSEKARGGKLNASEMQGGCFTISSLGGIGGTAFTPIINAPEVAILGVSKSGMKPVYKDGTFIPRLTLPLSLSYDHRVIDGAMAVRFTTYLAGLLADPRQLTEAVP